MFLLQKITTDLSLPIGMSPESSGVSIMNHVVDRLAAQFRFGYHEVEDMHQQGMLYAWELISAGLYDDNRPLEKILYVHVRNRYINMVRDNLHRADSPCKRCPFYDPNFKKSDNQCSVFTDKSECEKFARWDRRNHAKRSLMNLSPESDIQALSADVDYDMDYRDTLEFVRSKSDDYLYNNFVKLLNGTLSEDLIEETRADIKSILGEDYGKTK